MQIQEFRQKEEKYSQHNKQIIQKVRKGYIHAYIQQIPQQYWNIAQYAKERTYMMISKGTAYALSPDGLVATCSHCVRPTKNLQLINLKGQTFIPQVIAKYKDLDISLLKINIKNQKYFQLGSTIPPKGTQIMCIGNPDPFDRSQKKSYNVRTNFLPYNVSIGKIIGCKGDGIIRTGNLGPLKHCCWTYWGHSGGPIIDMKGILIGMHNSWDSTTGTRRGMTCLSIRQALKRYQKKYK